MNLAEYTKRRLKLNEQIKRLADEFYAPMIAEYLENPKSKLTDIARKHGLPSAASLLRRAQGAMRAKQQKL